MGILDKQQSCKHVTQAQIPQRPKKKGLICLFLLMTSLGAYPDRDVTEIRPEIYSLTVKAGAL